MKINNKKGFTLIELMIVIAIIGILAITVVPRLTGAQAKARDTGRISNVKNVTAALASYYGDFGIYPKNDETNTNVGCLSDDKGLVNGNLADYFESKKAPIDPTASNKTIPCNLNASLGYKSLTKDNSENTAYLIVTDVEQDVAANTILDVNTDNYTDYKDKVGGKEKKDKSNDAEKAVYAELHY